ncbi:N-acetylglucosamine-1-phosphodiester alpha-N-acetylglucosaminidase-like [Symphorus nematophorus]
MTLVRDPLRTLSVLEPGGPDGCEKRRRATAEQTAVAAGCLYAQNAGFFNGTSDRRLGDVVSDGRMVRDSGGQQNAQFGIRKDGSLVFGYLSQEDVLDRSNPFVQLVSGVVWLLRKGEIYINQSLKAECDDTVEHEEFRDFVDVLSARTVVGHDADGDLILFHVDGKSKKRGMNLWEVADFLKKNGVIDAINLDGGGSSSFVINGTLASYPPDRCKSDSRWRCARDVSTVLCVHRRRCEPADRGGHGDCVNGRRRCQQGWRGAACDSLVCRPPACGPHGVCSANGCVCDAGWRGKNCSQVSFQSQCRVNLLCVLYTVLIVKSLVWLRVIIDMKRSAEPEPDPEPEPSCVSFKSDRSNDRLFNFKGQQPSVAKRSAEPEPDPEPEPSCVSFKSDRSNDRLFNFKGQQPSAVKR